MTGLFKNIQGYFRASYSGRYLALLLCELAGTEPNAFFAILPKPFIRLPHSKTKLLVEKEWSFRGKDQDRLADLAILNEMREPLLLVEIKDADGVSKPNEAQLSDYRRFLEKNTNTKFLLLTKHVLREDDQREFDKAKQLPVRHMRFTTSGLQVAYLRSQWRFCYPKVIQEDIVRSLLLGNERNAPKGAAPPHGERQSAASPRR